LFPGLQIQAVSARRVMVPTEEAERAMEVLSALVPSPPREGKQPFWRAVADAIRMVAEVVFFGVFVPRNSSRYASDE
jgi:hypothetical protein